MAHSKSIVLHPHSHNMSFSKDASLYGFQRPKRLKGDKAISSNTTSSFTSQLSSLINKPKTSSTNEAGARPKASRTKAKKEDIFATHNRNSAARAQRDLDNAASPAFVQKHTTNGEGLDGAIWERSKRKMEEKARLYAAMKRGDVEDEGERFAVDFDRKWAEKYGDGQSGDEDLSEEDEEEEEEDGGMVEYVDEFGRTRQGTRADAARVARQERGLADMTGDRFTARPSAPSAVIYGDTIQHQAFNPDMPIAMQMEELAKKRDRSLTPPPDLHFDASKEVRQKGTGFFQFSEDAEERKKQMADLERERLETERVRREREKREAEQVPGEISQIERGQSAQEAQAAQDAQDKRGYKRKADDFFDELAAKMAGKTPPPGSSTTKEPEDAMDAMDAMQRIEAALAREAE